MPLNINEQGHHCFSCLPSPELTGSGSKGHAASMPLNSQLRAFKALRSPDTKMYTAYFRKRSLKSKFFKSGDNTVELMELPTHYTITAPSINSVFGAGR
jgi:hypothetical protein